MLKGYQAGEVVRGIRQAGVGGAEGNPPPSSARILCTGLLVVIYASEDILLVRVKYVKPMKKILTHYLGSGYYYYCCCYYYYY